MDVEVPTRAVRVEDGPLFCRLWRRLSAETVYRRFHAPLHRPPAGALTHLVTVDHDLREAVVAVVGAEIVGVARYDRRRAEPSCAEIAVVVEDAWQGFGVARQLLGRLAALAARRGVTDVAADVQPDNERVLALVARLAPAARLHPHGDVLAVRGPLPVPGAAAPAAAPAVGSARGLRSPATRRRPVQDPEVTASSTAG